jgi:hypothetical protein
MISKYFNPYTDFGFKKLFGEEGSIDFLNQLLPAHHQIAQLSFKNPENFSNTAEERKAIFDIYCESAREQARAAIFEYIAVFDNRIRIHSANGNLTVTVNLNNLLVILTQIN